MTLPNFFPIRVAPRGPLVDDVEAALRSAFDHAGFADRVHAGDTVAIGAGSRGITDGPLAVGIAVELFLDLGCRPFVVPAMGSHGGATAEAQSALLAGYGIDEANLGVPVRATMETVVLGHTARGVPVHLDANAAAADHVFLVNRVKPHTNYAGPVESGLCKMTAYGLGKRNGADAYHGATVEQSFADLIAEVIPIAVEHGKILGGFGLIERGDDRTAEVHALFGDRFLVDEPALQARSAELLATIPFPQTDIVVIDEIGKNISGTGFDPNVVGRKDNHHNEHPDPDGVSVTVIAVRGLTEATHGNGLGIGNAEFVHRRAVQQLDHAITRVNAQTARDPQAAMVPIDCATDRDLIERAMAQLGPRGSTAPRMLWIRNTLDVLDCWASEACLDEAAARTDIEIVGPPTPLPFDDAGELPTRAPRSEPAG